MLRRRPASLYAAIAVGIVALQILTVIPCSVVCSCWLAVRSGRVLCFTPSGQRAEDPSELRRCLFNPPSSRSPGRSNGDPHVGPLVGNLGKGCQRARSTARHHTYLLPIAAVSVIALGTGADSSNQEGLRQAILMAVSWSLQRPSYGNTFGIVRGRLAADLVASLAIIASLLLGQALSALSSYGCRPAAKRWRVC